MEVIRRNTDYALRAMVNLAANYGQAVSARQLADQEGFSYQLACKLMQSLQKAGMVKSAMGAQGGYMLAKAPAEISVADVVGIIQGPVMLNKCLLGSESCCTKKKCPIRDRLSLLQGQLDSYLTELTLEELVNSVERPQ